MILVYHHRKETRTINLTNETLVPVVWKTDLTGMKDFECSFNLSAQCGRLPPKSCCQLAACFQSDKVAVMEDKSFMIQVN